MGVGAQALLPAFGCMCRTYIYTADVTVMRTPGGWCSNRGNVCLGYLSIYLSNMHMIVVHTDMDLLAGSVEREASTMRCISLASVLLLSEHAVGLTVGGALRPAVALCRHSAVVCEEEMSINPPDEEELFMEEEELSMDAGDDSGMECSGRVVTELKDLTTGGALPERMTVKIRALQGEYSPPEGASDTEHDEGTLLAGLVGFPTDLPLKVVSQSGIDVDQLVRDMTALANEASPPVVTMRPGGRASISFEVRCEDASSLGATRASLLADPRIKMVF